MKKVLKFSASWCGPCKALAMTMNSVKTDVEVENVDIDENMELAAKYGIRGVPTMVMLEDGHEVKRVSGALTKDKLEGWLND